MMYNGVMSVSVCSEKFQLSENVYTSWNDIKDVTISWKCVVVDLQP